MYNILVVDDDREIVKAIEIYLKREGYNVIKAYDGIEAMNSLKENEIHLVILDIMMPNQDGLATLEKIRKNSSIPVILLSAKSEDYDKISGLETTFVPETYLPKLSNSFISRREVFSWFAIF